MAVDSSLLFAREDLGQKKDIHICGFEEFSCLGVFTFLQCFLLEKTYILSSNAWIERGDDTKMKVVL